MPIKGDGKSYSYKGEELTIKEISKITGIAINTIRSRLKNGLDIVEASESPVHKAGAPSKGSVSSDHNKRRRRKLTVFATCTARVN